MWLSVWNEVQIASMWSSRCHCRLRNLFYLIEVLNRFTMRCYASALPAMALSVCHKSVFCLNHWTDQADFFAWNLSSTRPRHCYKEIQIFTKNKGNYLLN